MAIKAWPDDVKLEEMVHCIACRQMIVLADATAGLHYADGSQAFACNNHFWDGTSLIRGWTDFLISQEYVVPVSLQRGVGVKG